MANAYDLGDLVRCSGLFTDSDDVSIDPDSVFCKVKNPGGTITEYKYSVNPELVRDDTGEYHVDVDMNKPGDWWCRFYSTGSGQAAGEGTFWVRVSRFS